MMMPQRLVFPEIDMTREVNNIDMYWHLPLKLWLLTTRGPCLGPAVLFWSYLAVIALSAVLLGRFAPSPLKTHQWFLLGIGMATLDVKSAVLVAGWFIAVELRKKKLPSSPIIFNLMQIGLVVWSLVVAISFFHAVQNGLLGIPDMQVVGNGSQSRLLHWTADRAEGIIPRPRVIVWSLYIYRAAMFCWALWLAKNTVLWSKWAVRTLRHEGAWRKHALKALKKHKNEN